MLAQDLASAQAALQDLREANMHLDADNSARRDLQHRHFQELCAVQNRHQLLTSEHRALEEENSELRLDCASLHDECEVLRQALADTHA